MYKDHLEPGSEVYYDFSNRKNADDLVKNNTAGSRYVSNSSDGGKSDAGKISSDGVKTDQNIEKKPDPSIVVMSPGTKINATTESSKATQSSATPVDQKTVPNDVEKKPTGSIIVMSPGTTINAASPSQKTTQSSTMPVDQKTVPNDAEKKPTGSIIAMSPGITINTAPASQKTVRNEAEKKPTGSIIAMSPGIKINTAPASQKPTQSSANVQNVTSNTAGSKNTAGVALPPSQKSVSPTEKPKPIVEAIPSWTDSVRYELYIEAGDSLAWIAKDYTNALKWYDSALRIRPNAALPKKQIKAVKQLQLQSVQLAADKAKKDRFDKAMAHYKKADALKAERKYAEAHAEYTKCVDAADTTKLSEYTAAQLYYINDARDYVVRLQHYLPKPVVDTPPPPAPVEPEKKKKRKKSN